MIRFGVQIGDRQRMGRGILVSGLLAALAPIVAIAQSSSPITPSASGGANGPPAASPAASTVSPEPRSRDRRHAARLYLDAGKLYVDSQFEEAMQEFDKAAALDPTNKNYAMAADVARSHAVTALVQEAAKDRLMGNDAAAREVLSRALALDPNNFEISQHLDDLAGDALSGQPERLYQPSTGNISAPLTLAPAAGAHSFHVRGEARQLIQQVYQAYGVMPMLDDSLRPMQVRLDLDDANFQEATRVLSLLTNSFYVPLDARHALVARDSRDNRQKYERQELETVYLPGISDDDMKDVQTLAKNVFLVTQQAMDPTARSITLRAPDSTLNAFNNTIHGLLDGRSQVLLDVRMIQVAHTSNRNTGVQLPQSITAFNVFAEEQSLLSQNASLVQQIISSGLASPNDPLAILGILIASGQVSSSLFANGFAVFGGGITQSALTPGATTINLNLNTSDSRELDQIQLRLQDGEKGTLKEGERYPIQTSSFSSLSPNLPNIPGLTGAGSSSSLSSLLSSLTSTVPNIPMVQYEDLGLSLAATPKVMRNDDVALTIELKLDALSGASIDGNPVLDNRAYTGVVTLREGEAAVVATEVDKSESHAISGTPGIGEIPGLNDLTEKDVQQNYATIVIVMTPHVIRGTQAAGHSAMMRVEKDVAQ